jgi:ComF family protein
MFLTRTTQLFYDASLALAYPQACAICGRSVEQRRFGVACEACWRATRIFNASQSKCWKCGLPSVAEFSSVIPEDVRCMRCDQWSFTAARAAGAYEGALRESVLLLKREPYLSQHVEELLLATAMREPLNRCSMIIPVPLHAKRARARGFNQASVIAQLLSRKLNLPFDEISLVRVSASEKYRAGLDAKGRRDTVAGAFAVGHPRLVENEDILLIDDVFTTGATVSACAEALVSAGARTVFVLTVARARS